MKISDIAEHDWPKFCKRITDIQHDSRIDIQVQETSGDLHALGDGLLLKTLAFDEKSDRCNNLMFIEAARESARPFQHRIIEPISVRLKEGDNQRCNELQIQAENGTTLVTFHPGIHPKLMKDSGFW